MFRCPHLDQIGRLAVLGGLLFSVAGAGNAASPNDFRIPLLISGLPSKEARVLYVGVPFPRDGTLSQVAVVDDKGTRVPSSSRMMARWPESRSVRWLGVDFIGNPEGQYFVVPASEKPAPAPQVQVSEEADGFTVITGPAKFVLPKTGALIREAYRDHDKDGRFDASELVLENTLGDDLYIVDQEGHEAVIGNDSEHGRLVYESGKDEKSPDAPVLRAVFRCEGWYQTPDGRKIARHVTRLQFEVGQSRVKIEHSLIVSEDTGKVWFRDYGMRLRYAEAAKPSEIASADSADAESALFTTDFTAADREIYLFQEKAFSFSRMDPVADCHFQMGKIDSGGADDILKSGSFAPNWLLAGNAKAAVGIALQDFWQSFPKEIASTHDTLTLHLWSPRSGLELDFRPEAVMGRWPAEWIEQSADKALMERIRKIDTNALGLARTHEFVIDLQSGFHPEKMAESAARIQMPDVAIVDPHWLRFTEAMGKLHPFDPDRFPEAEAWINEWFDQHTGIWRQWGDYGFFEQGNWPHVWYRRGVKGPLKDRWHAYVDRYSALMDYGFYAHVWRAFARTGDRRYFDAAREVNRHRLDFAMAHWDETKPDVPLKFDHYGRVPRRLKGTYTMSNSPITWGGRSGFHHNSGTDIRALAWWYYLADERRAMEMLRAYGNAIKQTWNARGSDAFRGSRPFAILKNLATVYQETGDPDIKAITLDQVHWLADLDAPQGVSREKEATGLGKYGVKAGAMERVYEVMGDELATKSLLKGAATRATTSMGETPLSYFNVEGEQLAAAYYLTKDPVYIRALRRDMEVALDEFKSDFHATGSGGSTRDENVSRGDAEIAEHKKINESSPRPPRLRVKSGIFGLKDGWLPMWHGVGPSAAGNVYAMGGMAHAMDAIADYEKTTGKKAELTPFVRQAGFGPLTLAVIEKAAGKAVQLDVRGVSELAPVLYDASGNPVKEIEKQPFKDQLYSITPAATRWTITLPANLPEGAYFIDGGANGAGWEVTWTNAPFAVLYAPKGFIIGKGGRQWGNRVMPAYNDHNASVYFEMPREAESFDLAIRGTVELKAPDGSSQALDKPGRHTIKVTEAQRGKLWELKAVDTAFVELHGIPPFVAYGDPGRFFLPDIRPEALAKLPGFPARPLLMPDAESKPFFKVDAPDGQPDTGLLLVGNRRLEIPNASLIDPRQGTMECWLMPTWQSADHFLKSNPHMIMDAKPWQIVLHRFGEMSITALVGSHGADKSKSSIETNAGIVLEPGRWTHVALQWKQADDGFHLEFFVNGRRQRYGIGDSGMATIEKDFQAAEAPATLLFGGAANGRQNLDAGLAGLRFSKVARYTNDFNPNDASTLKTDAHTTALFLFENENTGNAQLINP